MTKSFNGGFDENGKIMNLVQTLWYWTSKLNFLNISTEVIKVIEKFQSCIWSVTNDTYILILRTYPITNPVYEKDWLYLLLNIRHVHWKYPTVKNTPLTYPYLNLMRDATSSRQWLYVTSVARPVSIVPYL